MPLVCPLQSSIGDEVADHTVLAKYLFACNGHTPTDWELKGVAIAGYTVATLRKKTLRHIPQVTDVLQSSLSTPDSHIFSPMVSVS